MSRGKIGILLTASPAYAASRTALRVAEAALDANYAVELFLMEDGLYHVLPTGFRGDPAAHLAKLVDRGLVVQACAYNAMVRGVAQGYSVAVTISGQEALARLVHDCDRFLSFG